MDNLGKWVLLTKKLPTEISPPKLSVHFAIPWINTDWVREIYSRLSHISDEYLDLHFREYPMMNCSKYDENVSLYSKIKALEKCPKEFDDMWGHTDNPVYDIGILYKGEKIRVHVHEYNVIKPKFLKEVFPGAYDFIPSSEIEDSFNSIKLSKEKKVMYEEALVDGCTEYQAMQIVYGRAVQDFPAPVGWYKPKLEYARVFCRDWEMKE